MGGNRSQSTMVAQTAAELSLASLKGEDEDGLKSAPHNVAATPELLDPEASGKYDGVSQPRRGGALGAAEMVMDLFVRYGVEAWGIQPRPEDERERLTIWSYLPQWTFWAAINTNILTFSAGMLGPGLFGLDFRASVLCIVFFGAASCIPPAFLAANGPRLGMRQMVQARYAFGYYLAVVFGLVNCVSYVMFLSLTVILGGQSLSLASNSDMTWTVGIVIVAILALLMSFVGLRALHILSLTSFPVIIVLYIVLVGVMGDKLHLVYGEAIAEYVDVTASGVLAFGATLIGYTVSYCGLASDFTTSIPPHTPRWKLFTVVYTGLFIPIILIQILGAAAQLVAFSFTDWTEASFSGTPNLLFVITGAGGAARFVMILFCLSVIANTAPTIYSAGLNAQVAIPWLVRVPRYFLAFVVSAVYLPVAIAGSTHFYTVLSNFSAVLGYWQAIFIPPMILEAVVFRAPVSRETYPIDAWDQPKKLPTGIPVVVAGCCGIPLIAAGMAQTWWVGWIARAIPGGDGDLAFELTFVVVSLIYIPLRYLERKHTGR